MFFLRYFDNPMDTMFLILWDHKFSTTIISIVKVITISRKIKAKA